MNEEMRQMLAMMMAQSQKGGGAPPAGMPPEAMPQAGQGPAGPPMPEMTLQGTSKAPQMTGQFALPMPGGGGMTMSGNLGRPDGPGSPVDWGAMLGLNKPF